MYDDIYSLYGPMYNAVYGLVYVVLQVPLTHTAGRLIAAALWLAYTAGFAVFCHRVTRSVATTLFCYLLVLVWLARLMHSPGHPQGMCLLLLATVLLLACSIERARSIAALVGIGVAVTALALVKVNIGAYVGGGLVLVLLRVTSPTVWTRIAIPAVAAALLVLPFAVQALLFEFAWVRLHSLFSVLTIGAALLVFSSIRLPVILRPTDWWFIAGVGGLTCLVVVGGMMLAGSSAHAILDATLLQNAHFIRNWYRSASGGPTRSAGRGCISLSGLRLLRERITAPHAGLPEPWHPRPQVRVRDTHGQHAVPLATQGVPSAGAVLLAACGAAGWNPTAAYRRAPWPV